MNILALETATPSCSVALLSDGEVFHLEDNTPHSHTQKILPMVDALLTQQNLSLAQIGLISFDEGPGSFTGLRIGAGVSQGLALANGIPTAAVSSLEAMAQQVKAKYMAVVLDARMEEVYFACFQFKDDVCLQLSESTVLPISQITLAKNKEWVLIGNGWKEYGVPEELAHFKQQFTVLPHAREIAILAQNKSQRPHNEALPVYIRNV